MHPLTKEFVRPGARLRLTMGAYDERPEVAPQGIFIEGNAKGFRSLAELISLYLNELENVLPLSTLQFVSSELPKSFTLRFSYGDQDGPLSYGLVVEADNQLEWNLTEAEASVIATSVHGIHYAYEHIHFDPVVGRSEYAVYCELEVDDRVAA